MRRLGATALIVLFSAVVAASPTIDFLVSEIAGNARRVKTLYLRPLPQDPSPSVDLGALAEKLSSYKVPSYAPKGLPAEAPEPEALQRMSLNEFEEAFAEAGNEIAGLTVGRALYRAKSYDKALPVLKAAFEQEENREVREWVLMMMADCLCRTDPGTAAATYRDFLKAYPDSEWYLYAEFRAKFLNWQITRGDPTVLEETR